MIERTRIQSRKKLPIGEATIEIVTRYAEKRPAGPLHVTLKVNGQEFAAGLVPISAPFAFSTDGFDVGTDLGSPVSRAYFDDAPFSFNGQIEKVRVEYTK